MAITSEQLAQLTARTGVARCGTARAGAVAKSYELRVATADGQFIWQRPVATDGDPDDTASGWVTGRE